MRAESNQTTEAGPAAQAQASPAGNGRGVYSWIRGKKAARSRITTGSPLYTRVLPALILGMGILTAALILFAAGVLLGIIPFR